VDEPEGVVLIPARTGFDRFYQDQYRQVLTLAFALCGNRETAEDLTQDAFVAAHQDWQRIGGYEVPGAWARRAVANRAISKRRRALSETRALLRLGGRRDGGATPGDPDAALWKAVRQLPRRQAQVVALIYLEDLSVAEAAAILGCSEGTAKTHLRRAKQALSKQFGADYQEDR
jgi:RNA polymerase sigma-70 factor (ECF subfamily)